jgi:hypothetical protein
MRSVSSSASETPGVAPGRPGFGLPDGAWPTAAVVKEDAVYAAVIVKRRGPSSASEPGSIPTYNYLAATGYLKRRGGDR